ncbi:MULTISPECIES: hypothetical protein [unclassified Mycobacterium]|uniref:hypothetical protein n=1 Tax=unclassified Mycobacterium TaxID=2642494 RepID=UPI0029C79B7A|nr:MULTISPECIES: hypothetical protein [unclassified Mycobacterium]
MSKLHAQMALLGTIDEVVRHATNGDTVKLVEAFLPGTTGIGQQGWYRELKHFLSRDELFPRDENGDVVRREGPVIFPTYAQAINELAAAPSPDELPASPAVRSRSMFAATILSIASEYEGGRLPLEGVDPASEGAPDALDALIPTIAPRVKESTVPTRGLDKSSDSSGDPAQDLKISLRDVRSRADYLSYVNSVARARDVFVDPDTKDVLSRPAVCTGSLRKLEGKFCTVLTTSWDTPFRLSQIAKIIDPHNWPDMCDFFVSMSEQDPIQPDRTRGWTRLLESVSGDETQWQMRTALRFWNGIAPPGDGIFVNYDLDDPPRVKDCGLLEVDAGYLWASPISGTGPDPVVKIRTAKQVRIRGVSPTATAALACGFGWGDAMSQMFSSGVEHPPHDPTPFAPSTETAAPAADVSQSATQRPAEEVELLPGWRKAIIKAMQLQMTRGIDTAAALGSEFAVRWSDGEGFSLDDVNAFGGRFGTELTDYATGIFKEAAAALQPQSDGAAPGGDD